MVTKCLLQMSVRELNNSMVIRSEEGVINEAIFEKNNIIISDSTIRNIITPQLKNITTPYKVMWLCECCIYSKIMHSYLL